MRRTRSAFKVLVLLCSMSIVGAAGVCTSQQASAPEGIIQRSGLSEDLLNRVYPVYRFHGATQTEAEALFGSAIAAIYYPDRGEVRLIASDDLQTAQEWLEMKARREGFESAGKSYPPNSALRSKLKSTARMSLRGFLEPGTAVAGIGIEITDDPYLVKVPHLKTTDGLLPAAMDAKRISTESINKDYTYIYDDFEGDTWSLWSRWDDTDGQYTWGVRSCDSYGGSYSADAARGGSQGALLGCQDPYPNSVEMYMYAELCQTILPSWKAFMELQFKASIESDGDDGFRVRFGSSLWEATGWTFYGTWSDWFTLVFNLRQWVWQGDLGQNECNTLILGFESDSLSGSGYGARVDDLYIFFGDTVGSYECGIIADPDSGESPLTVAFRATTDLSSPAFYWRFGDGATSEQRDPVHVYTSAGTYNASLFVNDSWGTDCTSSMMIDVSQGTCTYSISPSSASSGPSGGTGSISVSAPSGCSWTASTSQSWIHITGGSTGSGNGTVSYSVDSNSGTSSRSGSIQVAGKTFTINQEGATSCSYTISPTSRAHDSDGGTGTVSVSTSSGCTWTASRNTSWITITGGSSGTGNGTVSYRVDANSNTTSRTGTMTIAGERFTVTQAASSGPPPSGEFAYYSVIAHTPGELDSLWVSSMSLCNLSSSRADSVLTYQYGHGNSVEKSVSVPASGIVEWLDTASDLFGVTGNSSGIVEIVVDFPLQVAVRTFNSSDIGTFGQSLPGVTVEQSMTQGEIGTISPVKRTPEFRTNIGFINTGTVSCSVEVTFMDGNGSQIGNQLSVSLQPGQWKQKNDMLGSAGIDYAQVAYAVMTVDQAGAKVWAYATVIDNATGDPTGLPLTEVH